MVFYKDVDRAISFLQRAGDPVDVLVCYNSHSKDDQPYFRALWDMRRAWANVRNRLGLDVFGVQPSELPGCDSSYVPVWAKVALMKEVSTLPRMRFAIWCDSDACLIPDLSLQRRNVNHKCLNKTLSFLTLCNIWAQKATKTTTILGYRECFKQPHGCPYKACKCSQMFRASDMRGTTPKGKEGHHSFNAGVFMVKAHAPDTKQLFEQWLAKRPKRAQLNWFTSCWCTSLHPGHTLICSRTLQVDNPMHQAPGGLPGCIHPCLSYLYNQFPCGKYIFLCVQTSNASL